MKLILLDYLSVAQLRTIKQRINSQAQSGCKNFTESNPFKLQRERTEGFNLIKRVADSGELKKTHNTTALKSYPFS